MRRSGFLSMVVASLVVLVAGSNSPAAQTQPGAARGSQPSKPGAPAAPPIAAQASDDKVSHGRYIVEDVAVCWRCHTPVDSTGGRDHCPVAHGRTGWYSDDRSSW